MKYIDGRNICSTVQKFSFSSKCPEQDDPINHYRNRHMFYANAARTANTVSVFMANSESDRRVRLDIKSYSSLVVDKVQFSLLEECK